MFITLYKPPILRGTIHLPASKSLSNRALAITALSHRGRTLDDSTLSTLENISDCDDTRVMLAALRELPETIDIGAAGTAMRFLTAYLAVTPGKHLITGTERMRHRPIAPLVEALKQLGSDVQYACQEGYPPLRIEGRELKGGELEIPGNISSQYISALLMAGPMLRDGLTLHLVGQIISRPYIEMTIGLMKRFYAKIEWIDDCTIEVKGGGYCETPAYYVESDWSAASYWYEMMALTEDEEAEIRLPGLFRNSLQGDSAVAEMFRPLGVETTSYTDENGVEGIILTKGMRSAEPFKQDFTNQPDLAQTLVVTCAMLDKPFFMSGLQSLKIKETDRLLALCTELGKLGLSIREEEGRILRWNGERKEIRPNIAIDTYEDHRMAMAFAPICLKREKVAINDPQVVSKSYPSFWDDLEKTQFKLRKERV